MIGLTTKRRVLSALASIPMIAVLSACASFQGPPLKAEAAAATSTPMSMAQEDAMRAECKIMHESMMAKMADGKMMQDGKMMSSEMKSKHMACMELMPEMKAKMRAKCETLKDGDMKGMDACPMMQSGADSEGDKP